VSRFSRFENGFPNLDSRLHRDTFFRLPLPPSYLPLLWARLPQSNQLFSLRSPSGGLTSSMVALEMTFHSFHSPFEGKAPPASGGLRCGTLSDVVQTRGAPLCSPRIFFLPPSLPGLLSPSLIFSSKAFFFYAWVFFPGRGTILFLWYSLCDWPLLARFLSLKTSLRVFPPSSFPTVSSVLVSPAPGKLRTAFGAPLTFPQTGQLPHSEGSNRSHRALHSPTPNPHPPNRRCRVIFFLLWIANVDLSRRRSPLLSVVR